MNIKRQPFPPAAAPKRIAAWASMTMRQRQVWYDLRDAAYFMAWNKWRKS